MLADILLDIAAVLSLTLFFTMIAVLAIVIPSVLS